MAVLEGDKENKANGAGKRATLVLGERPALVVACAGIAGVRSESKLVLRRTGTYDTQKNVNPRIRHFFLLIESSASVFASRFLCPLPSAVFFVRLPSFEVPHAGREQDAVDPGVRDGARGEARDGDAEGPAEPICDRGETERDETHVFSVVEICFSIVVDPPLPAEDGDICPR